MESVGTREEVRMNIDALTVPSLTTDVTDRRSPTALIGLVVCAAAAIAAGGALVVEAKNATDDLAVLSCLALVWAGAGLVITVRQHCPAAGIVQAFAAAAAVGALSWSLNSTRDLHGAGGLFADLGQRLAVTLTPALVFHLLLTLPDGRLARASHKTLVWAGYITGIAMGFALLADRDNVLVWPVVVLWAATLLALPVAHANYRAAGVVDRRRMQWIGWALVVAAEVAVVSVALSLVTDWPHHDGESALAASGLLPLALAAGTVPRLLARVDRLLTHTVSLAGLTVLIVSAYLLALAAFGRKPNGSERSLLLLSMLAAAGAALAYQPARAWLTDRANRVVYV